VDNKNTQKRIGTVASRLMAQRTSSKILHYIDGCNANEPKSNPIAKKDNNQRTINGNLQVSYIHSTEINLLTSKHFQN